MKLYCLMENTASCAKFCCEHGLSIYLEIGEHRILFDSGSSPKFVENAEQLGIDLKAVDIAVLSHGHYDHSGGLKAFLELNKTAKVYASEHAFEPHFSSPERYIGVDKELLATGRFTLVRDRLTLDKGLELTTHNTAARPYYAGTYGQSMVLNNQFVPDTYNHEQYLTIEEKGKRIVISGCSHKGVMNIVAWLKPDILIGGFHFMKLEPEVAQDRKVLEDAAEVLNSSRAQFITCHCTGLRQYAFLQKRMPKLSYLAAGTVLEI